MDLGSIETFFVTFGSLDYYEENILFCKDFEITLESISVFLFINLSHPYLKEDF